MAKAGRRRRGSRKGKPPGNKGKRYASEPLTVDEVRALLKACSRRSLSGIRAAALIGLGWGSGLRVRECLSLRPGDVDHERGTVTVLWAKGGSRKRRTVGIRPDVLPLVDRWLDRRRELGVSSSAPLFCGYKGGGLGKPVPTAYVRRLMPKLAKRAGIEKRVTFHMLRHTMASELAASGMPMHAIQAQLGHASLAVTSTYLARVAPDQLGRMMAEHARKQNGETKPASPTPGALTDADVARIATALAALVKR